MTYELNEREQMFADMDRGYSRGVGTLLLPNGQQVGVSQEEMSLELANALARAAWELWEEHMNYVDPPDPPEEGAAQLRAKDLKNRVVVLRPVSVGEWPARAAADGKPAQQAQAWIGCECWVIDGSETFEQFEPEVRISWWRTVEQLKDCMGEFVVGRVTEQEDRSIILARLSDRQKAGVDRVWEQIVGMVGGAGDGAASPTPDGYDEEPF